MSKAGIFIIALVVVIFDRITKLLASAHLPLDVKAVTLIPHVLYLTRTSNTGSAFGLFPGSTAILAAVAGLCALGVVAFVLRSKKQLPRLLAIGLALPLGGALGNFYDRAFNHSVVDFIDLWLGKYEWPVFNVADSCICVGVVLIAVYTLRSESESIKEVTGSGSDTVKAEPSASNPE